MMTLDKIRDMWTEIIGDVPRGTVVCSVLVATALQDHPDFVGLPANERRGKDVLDPVYPIGKIGDYDIHVSASIRWHEPQATVTLVRHTDFDFDEISTLV